MRDEAKLSNYIQVINAQGITIINDEYKNISLTQSKKNIPVVPQYANEGFPQNAISYYVGKYSDPTGGTGIFPLNGHPACVFSCTNPNFSFYGFQAKNVFYLGIGGINGHQVPELNNAVSVYMFDYQTYTGNSKLGLQIFNENKDEIFNSNLKYLRVLDVIYYPPGLPTTSLIKTYNHKIGILIGAFKIGATDSGDPLFQCVSFPSENSIKIDASTGDSLEGTTNMLVINLDGVD